MNLQLTSTNDILEELASRSDVYVIGLIRKNVETSVDYDFQYNGSIFGCIGLLQCMGDNLRDQIKETGKPMEGTDGNS